MLNGIKSQTEARTPLLLLVLLAVQAFTTFLSETKFLPLKNNVGAFETTAAILIVVAFAYFYKNSRPIRLHPLIAVMGVWFVVALASLFNFPTQYYMLGVVATIIVLGQLFFTLALFNLLSLQRSNLLYLLRCFAISIAIVGLWVFLEQLASPGNFNRAIGPFRGRSHMGIYMMGAFWIMLLYRFWPGTRWWERWAVYPILALVLYAIAVALRQSIYVAMIFGLACLALSFTVIHGRERFNVIGLMIPVLGVIAILYLRGDAYLLQLALFRREAEGIEGRLQMAFASSEDSEDNESFDVLQREGAFQAFRENPILGIGWMGFYRSKYSPTGNELHNSPLRFMAELGIFGIAIYVSFMSILLIRAARLFWWARKTPYQLSALLLFIGLLTYAVSHYYNRMFTDRPYWFMLVIFLAFEALIQERVKAPSLNSFRALRSPYRRLQEVKEPA